MFDRYLTCEFYQTLCNSDFNRGYLSGTAVVLGVLVLFVLLRLVLKLIFRRHRCSQIVIVSSSGDLTIARNVIEGTTRQVLSGFAELAIRRIRLYRRGKTYSLQLCCTFFDGGKGVPEIAERIRSDVKKALEKQFGITTLQRIDLCVEEQDSSALVKQAEEDDSNADSGI